MAVPTLSVQRPGVGAVSADVLNTYVQVCDVISRLRTFTGLTNMMVFVESYTTIGDGGAGPFVWNPTSTAADNGTTIIAPNGLTTGRWIRLGFLLAAAQNIVQFVLTSSQVLALNTGWEYATVECIGGGGGGGGAAVTSPTTVVYSGGGGGSGGYSKANVHPTQATDNNLTITVGAGGAGGTAGANGGQAGGASSVSTNVGGVVALANGGSGGGPASNASVSGGGGAGASVAGAAGTLNTPGNAGDSGFVGGTGQAGYISRGGAAFFGGQLTDSAVGSGGSLNGPNATGAAAYGCGGCGGCISNVAASVSGGQGANGVVIVTIFFAS